MTVGKTGSARERSSAEDAAFAAIVRSSSDAVIAKTTEGIITAWNSGAERLYGWPSHTAIGMNVEVLFPPENRDDEQARQASVASGAHESGRRCTRLRASGERVDIVMSMSPMYTPDGRIFGVASISRETTASERADERYGSLLEAAPDAIICVNREGRVVTANGQAVELFGYSREELLGAQVEMLVPDTLKNAHVGLRRGFANRPRIRRMGGDLQLIARHRDGSTIPVEITLAPDGAGPTGLVIAAIRDVTARRALETGLNESEARLRQVAESVNLAFVLQQLEPFRALYVSSGLSRLLEREPEFDVYEAGQTVIDHVHPDDRAAVERDFLVTTRAGLSAQSEHRLITDRGIKWVRSIATPVPNPSGPVNRTVITIEDISQRVSADEALRAAEAAARAANDAKNHFLSRMSHELRTPLNAVIGFGDLLGRQLAGTEHAAAIGHVVKGGRHLLSLINDVLDITRIESGEMTISIEPVPIASVIRECLEFMRPVATDWSITIIEEPPAGDDTNVLADRQRLRQILLNLLSNAIKYNHPGGHVWMRWDATRSRATVSVRDDGNGIAPELLGRLFVAFDRLGAEASGIEGTGIGLALTRTLAERLGGSIAVETAPGEGSTFTVTLPLAPTDSPTTADEAIARTVSPHTKPAPALPATVLYIEDNEPNVRVIEHLLRLRPGWKLLHAEDGRTGIDMARAHKPDLVLLDLHLPDVSGRDVLITLKTTTETSFIPVAVLTADASTDRPEELMHSGADLFMTKPLDVDKVVSLLDSVARNRHSHAR